MIAIDYSQMSIMHLLSSFQQQHITLILFNRSIHLLLRLSFRIGLVMILITQYLISLYLLLLNQLKSVMIVLDQCKHSKSMDWIDWKRSKSARIRLLRSTFTLEMNRNHSTYWIVNHWNPFKLVNTVSVILLVNLNWRIYHNYNPFKLAQLEVFLVISIIVPLWFEVLNWYWIL